jgi:phytoene desaturase
MSHRLKNRRSAIVVGAGFGGMATALRLRRIGYAVTVIDNNPKAGGRAQVYEINGFKFDAGPTVITAPFFVRRTLCTVWEKA